MKEAEKEKNRIAEKKNKFKENKNKIEKIAYNFDTGINSWRDLGVQRASFIQNDIEANISNANFGNINF